MVYLYLFYSGLLLKSPQNNGNINNGIEFYSEKKIKKSTVLYQNDICCKHDEIRVVADLI